ncbi:Hypothetical predicted protein [Paramuricea clavata]|uniref:Uncharacterized protein n=1 Tax=Paramuricea clavata TaxID=317549 RepID=A0A7D9K8M0_PARCT|nr:Hypothetical predicted protein [Paramuricea clavata]
MAKGPVFGKSILVSLEKGIFSHTSNSSEMDKPETEHCDRRYRHYDQGRESTQRFMVNGKSNCSRTR